MEARAPSKPAVSLAVAALAIVPWFGALAGGLVYDDLLQIAQNPRLDLADLGGWWLQGESAWSGVGRPGRYNPIGWTVFVLEAWAAGGTTTPWVFHATSLLVHGAASGFLYATLRRLPMEHAPALLAALLFAWHPLQSEVACWPAARFESLALLLLLGGVFLAQRARSKALAFGAGVLAALSVLCKETAGPLAFFVPLAGPRRGATMGGVLAGLAASAALRFHAEVGAPTDLAALSASRLLASALELHRLAWLPTELSLLRPLPLSAAPLAIAVGLGAGVLALLTRRPATLVGAAWAGTVLAVHALASARYELLPDRYLYLALPGIALAITPALRRSRLARGAALTALAGFAAVAILQAPRWTDDLSLFGHERRVWPDAPQAAYQLGLAEARAGHPERAEAELLEATRLGPTLPQTWGELAALQANLGRADDARATTARALEILPSNPALLALQAQLRDR